MSLFVIIQLNPCSDHGRNCCEWEEDGRAGCRVAEVALAAARRSKRILFAEVLN